MPSLHWQRVGSCQIERILQNHEYEGGIWRGWRDFLHVCREGNAREEHQHGGARVPERTLQRGLWLDAGSSIYQRDSKKAQRAIDLLSLPGEQWRVVGLGPLLADGQHRQRPVCASHVLLAGAGALPQRR